MHRFLFQITLIIYAISSVGFIVQILTLRKDVERVCMWFLTAGFAVHTLAIGIRWVAEGHTPLVNLHESFSFLAWAMVGSFLLLQLGYKIKSLGAFLAPLATMAMGASSLQPAELIPLPPALKSLWLPVHASISLLAEAIFALAFCLSMMYLLQERQIKKKRLKGIFKRLPSLDTLDIMNERCLKVGFPLLTLGIITGSIWAEKAWGSYWSWDPKETWSLITWFLYAALLHQRLTVGWRGRRAAIMTIVAFATLVFTYLGASFLLSGAHSYATWFE